MGNFFVVCLTSPSHTTFLYIKSFFVNKIIHSGLFTVLIWYFGGCSVHGEEWLLIYCTVEWVGECG